METTTIQVKKTTVGILNRIKKRYSVSSYDGAIQKLAEKDKTIPKSMFGAHPEMKKFKRTEDDFHDI
ncbi:MAG: hypothetical protein HY392_01655 [Candidatus Diapherotrites archaeon]|nr:hypothetical protein [Candidatus Diapherotrites archaeon]